jgi:hypothetical protein
MKKSAETISLLRELAHGGATATEISRALSVTLTTVIRWAGEELIPLPTRSQARKKAWADPEVRARMSQARKKALADPEVRARMSQASKKALADPEVRARMSQARKKAWADPEVRARMSQASKKALADPEVRARMKAARAGAKGVEIPKWVPVDLWDEFLEMAAYQGEEAAASHIRRLKHEMAAA